MTESRAMPSLEQVAPTVCARNLKPGQVKRYPSVGVLFGYAVACPSCGFVCLHDNEAQFSEDAGRLRACAIPLPCLACSARISIADATFTLS